jgi:EmrB/QacA subfamily drug resistance transporter
MEYDDLRAAGTTSRIARGYSGIVWSVAFAAFMSKLDTYIVNISLPTISRYFNVGIAEASHTVIGYLVVGTSTLLFFGRLGDRIGLRKVFVWGYGLFTVGSLFCAASWTIDVLICARLIQGLGGAMLISAGYAIIPTFLPSNMTGKAFGVLTTAAMSGVIIGAPLGGFINDYLSWHWVFLINIPVGIVAAVTALRSLPAGIHESAVSPAGRNGSDIPGILLSFTGFSALLYCLTTGGNRGWTSPETLGMLVVGLLSISAFVIRERRCEEPLLDFALFGNRRFAFPTLAAFFGYMLMGGNAFLMPFYLEGVKGLDTTSVGLLLLINSATALVVGLMAGGLSGRIPPSYPATAAMASAALSSFYFAWSLHVPSLVPSVLFLIWFGFSYGMFVSPNNNQAMKAVPDDKHGMGSGIFNTVNTLGLAFGVALLELILSRSVPGGVCSPEHLSGEGGAVPDSVIAGFENAFIFGGVMCIAALALSAIVLISDARGKT